MWVRFWAHIIGEILNELSQVHILNQTKARLPLGGSCRCIGCNSLRLATHRRDGCTAMRRSNDRTGEGSWRSGGWTSNHGGGWSNMALNGGLGVKTGRNLRRGMSENLLTSAVTFDGYNFLLNRWRSGIIFFWLLLQLNDLGVGASKAAMKWFFLIGNESTRAIQLPTTSLSVQEWKLCDLHDRIDTKTRVGIDPIQEERGQGRRKQGILHKELAVNVPRQWRTWSKKMAKERKWSGKNMQKKKGKEYR